MTHLTLKSGNVKTGPIPVSTSSKENCPSTCPLKTGGCYAKGGPLNWHWNKVSDGRRGTSYESFIDSIKGLKLGQVWRHNQAGDLEGLDTAIDSAKLDTLAEANKGKRGFTYTHKPVLNNENADSNRAAIKNANAKGFTVNLSANTVAEADTLKALNIGPVVTVMPLGSAKLQTTPAGNKLVACPAQYKENVTCASCKLCSLRDRNFIIGFEAHGYATNKANTIASK